MNTQISHNRSFLFVTLLILLLASACNDTGSYQEYENKVYNNLENILEEKKSNLINYLDDTRELAVQAKEDQTMREFFKTKKEFYYLMKEKAVPQSLIDEIEKLKYNIQQYYIMNYLHFYDILFIDTQGEIFYTIRKEADYHKNIFSGQLAETALSKKIKNFPKESFVDFQFYEISGEPSAFFIEPVLEKNQTLGWMVMQCSVNKINKLFGTSKNLGITGEALLVNRNHYLLTNSRFMAEPTILKQRLPDENIEIKFREKKGKKQVIDYRGNNVISVFEVFEYFSSEWLIISKIDESEILTQFYARNQDDLFPILEKAIRHTPNHYEKTHKPECNNSHIYVDMDEYQRSDPSGILNTQGVSTCTGILVTLPGKFSYMAHVSPKDYIYNETRTDLVSEMMKQITYFEIPESRKPDIRFYITSTQLNSLKTLLELLISRGYKLDQIKFFYNPLALYGNFHSNCKDSSVYVDWKVENSNKILHQDEASVLNLHQLLHKKINED